MSEIKQFIQKFLDVSEVHYPDMLVNVKMMEDIVEGYVAQLEKQSPDDLICTVCGVEPQNQGTLSDHTGKSK